MIYLAETYKHVAPTGALSRLSIEPLVVCAPSPACYRGCLSSSEGNLRWAHRAQPYFRCKAQIEKVSAQFQVNKFAAGPIRRGGPAPQRVPNA